MRMEIQWRKRMLCGRRVNFNWALKMVVEYIIKMIGHSGEDCISSGLEMERNIVMPDSVMYQIIYLGKI